jgi:serine/threonine-protein kinase
MICWSLSKLWWKKKPAQSVPPKDVEQFLNLVMKSGLQSAADLKEYRMDFDAATSKSGDLDRLCTHLVSRHVLTAWQCDKLRQGKWKGFFLDGYCLLGQIGKDDTSSTYLCREVATHKYVAMRVTPPHFSTDGSFRYEIHDPPPDALPRT